MDFEILVHHTIDLDLDEDFKTYMSMDMKRNFTSGYPLGGSIDPMDPYGIELGVEISDCFAHSLDLGISYFSSIKLDLGTNLSTSQMDSHSSNSSTRSLDVESVN